MNSSYELPSLMMKRLGLFLIIPVLLFTASGCATTGRRAFLDGTPIALVSVASNGSINWKGEGTLKPNRAGKGIRRALRADELWVVASKTDDIMDEIEEIIWGILQESPQGFSQLIPLVPKETVINSRSYKEARINSGQHKKNMVTPAGYRLIDYNDKNFNAAFAEETGVEKTLYLTLNLYKDMIGGVGKSGNYKVRAGLTAMFRDSQGKRLFEKNYEGVSTARGKVTAGSYSQDEMFDLVRSALIEVTYRFMDDLF